MSPIDESDLRRELRAAQPPAPFRVPDPDALSPLVAARGRRVRLTRRITAGVASAAVLAAGAWGALTLAPDTRTAVPAPTASAPLNPLTPTPTATPTLEPSVTASPTHTPTPKASSASARPTHATTPSATARPTGPATSARPTPTRAAWTSTTQIPGQYGDLKGIQLALDTAPGHGPRSTKLGYCPEVPVSLPELRTIQAGRSVETLDPQEGVSRDAILVFGTEVEASHFIRNLGSHMEGCVEAPLTVTGTMRSQYRLTEDRTGGTYGLFFRSFMESNASGTWLPEPAAGGERWVQKGRVVVMAFDGGEIPGDPATVTGFRSELQRRLDVALVQTCKLDGAC